MIQVSTVAKVFGRMESPPHRFIHRVARFGQLGAMFVHPELRRTGELTAESSELDGRVANPIALLFGDGQLIGDAVQLIKAIVSAA
jgi:hypothetical protein